MDNNEDRIDCDYSYDDELISNIDFYTKHPEYMPFIGKDYKKFKILLVSESHYEKEINYSDQAIGYSGSFKEDSFNNDDGGVESFNYWYDKGIPKELYRPDPESVYDSLIGWFTTRKVVNRWCLDAERAENAKQIFSYTIKPMKILLDKKESRDTPSNEIYNYYAFMNYFQRPSRSPGGNSEFSDKGKITGEDKTVAKEVLTKVIKILDPNVVFFISAKAYDYFNIRDKKYIRLVHPTRQCCWNRSSKYCKDHFNGRTPKEEFGYVLEKLYDKLEN